VRAAALTRPVLGNARPVSLSRAPSHVARIEIEVSVALVARWRWRGLQGRLGCGTRFRSRVWTGGRAEEAGYFAGKRSPAMDCRAEVFPGLESYCAGGVCKNASADASSAGAGEGEEEFRCVCEPSWALDIMSPPRCSVSLRLQRAQLIFSITVCSVIVAQLLFALARGRLAGRRKGGFKLLGLLLNLALLATDLARWRPVESKSGWIMHATIDYMSTFCFGSVFIALGLEKYTEEYCRSVAKLRGTISKPRMGLTRVSVQYLVFQAASIAVLILVWLSVHWRSDIAFFTVQIAYCCVALAATVCYAHAIIMPVDAEIKSFLTLDDALVKDNIIKGSAVGDKARKLQRKLTITYRCMVAPCAALIVWWLGVLVVLFSPAGHFVAAQATQFWFVSWYIVSRAVRPPRCAEPGRGGRDAGPIRAGWTHALTVPTFSCLPSRT
jgi:hypothetical protein